MSEVMFNNFLDIGLSSNKAKETLKNENLSKILNETVIEARKHTQDGIPKSVGNLLYHIASKLKSQTRHNLPLLVEYVAKGKIDSELKLNGALNYIVSHPTSLNINDFEASAGVGITVTPEQVEKVVEHLIAESKNELIKKRYTFNIGQLTGKVREALPFADGKSIKNEIDVQILDLLGPKTAEDMEKPAKVKVEKSKGNKELNKVANEKIKESGATTIMELMKTKVFFHKPGENFKADGYVITPNTMQLLKDHLKVTGGKVRTRFPPEPNGILHIGHAKAININFGYALAHDGVCFLRFDDTNPEKEEEMFFHGIIEMVEWLNYKPYAITYSSDYFEELFQYAYELIKRDMAYICHQKQEDIKGFNPPPSPWRNRPVAESLQLFLDMKHGKIEEGGATLRMKVTLKEGKQDPVAYRIKFVPHYRTGNKWCIYPTYDFTHCLCDSLENITHSLCTKEFQSRRSSYYWLCNALDIYCPVQWEYGRLNISYTVVSKRKIAKLIDSRIVRDWDDPRLFTLTALRRRGFPSEAINNFCAQMGLTGAQTVVDPQMLEAYVRDVLNIESPRIMVVLEPLKLVITNFPHASPIEIDVPNFPSEPDKGTHKIVLSNTVYIEESDFKEKGEKDFRRLTKDQPVGLRYAGLVIYVQEVIKDEIGNIIEVKVVCKTVQEAEKPKAFIHWLSNPMACEVRLYDRLFKHKNPENLEEVPGGFLSDCNLDSLKIIENAFVDASLKEPKVHDRFQFERVGFFCVDRDTVPGKKLVFNRTVTLKEDAGK